MSQKEDRTKRDKSHPLVCPCEACSAVRAANRVKMKAYRAELKEELGGRVFSGPRGEKDNRLKTEHPDFLAAQEVLARAFENEGGDAGEIERAKALLAGARESRPVRPDVDWVEDQILPVLDIPSRTLAHRFLVSQRQINRWRRKRTCEGPCGRSLPVIAFSRGLQSLERMCICKQCIAPIRELFQEARDAKAMKRRTEGRKEAIDAFEEAFADLLTASRARRAARAAEMQEIAGA